MLFYCCFITNVSRVFSNLFKTFLTLRLLLNRYHNYVEVRFIWHEDVYLINTLSKYMLFFFDYNTPTRLYLKGIYRTQFVLSVLLFIAVHWHAYTSLCIIMLVYISIINLVTKKLRILTWHQIMWAFDWWL